MNYYKWQIMLLVTGGLVLSALVMGFYQFALKSGDHQAIAAWQDNLDLPLIEPGPNLVMFLHPRCGCSLASLKELKQLVDRSPADLKVTLVIMKYEQVPDADEKDFQEGLKGIRGARILRDPAGNMAKNLGAMTSGITYLVANDRKIIFQGGLTPSRGHEGETIGQAFILDWLRTRREATVLEKVFGCGL